ncbi:very large A-kinase anchor protein isoform X2 [Dendrobates tinctorius]|uniref:very large A-kinase anchor protein isoform X2 n=1 Tax=Dendrobates tinctorius TaxID=92724 RepID=UPI003CC9D343
MQYFWCEQPVYAIASRRDRYEDNHSNLTMGRHEDLSSTEPEHVTREPTSSLPTHNISEPEDEKDEEFAPNSKVLDSEKQSRENFFHFIGNLFHFSPKSSLGNLKQGNDVQEPGREHEEAQVINNLDKEDLYQERTQDDHTETEEDSKQNTARQQEQEDSGVDRGETSKDLLENVADAAIDPPKLNGHVQDAPAITYGTYRGSRRIRKLLKRRADVNSPIPEKEENPETCSAGETNTENCLMLHERIKMDPVPDRNCQDEIPPSKIHKKMQSKLEPLEQNSQLHNDNITVQNAKSLKFKNDLEMEANDRPVFSHSEEFHPENFSEIVEGQQPNIEAYIKDVPQLNAKESSKCLQPNTVESLEELHPTLGGSSNILAHIKQNGEYSENHSLESSNSENLEPSGQYTDIEPKELGISDIVRHQQPNSEQSDHQPNIKECVRFPEILQTNTDDNVMSKTDPSLKEAQNLLVNTKGKLDECMTEQMHVTSDSSDSEKYEKFSVRDNLHPEPDDTLMRTEELEESSEENTDVSFDLGGSGAVSMQSPLKQSDLEEVLDSQDWAGNQKGVEVTVHSEDKLHKKSSNILHPTAHNILEMSSGKNCDGLNSSTSDHLKLELGRISNTVDLQSDEEFASRSTVDVKPTTLDNSEIEEQLQLYRDRYPKQPDQELKGTYLDKTLSQSEDIPNLHLELIKMPRTFEDPKQIENIVDLPTSANIIPQNDVQNNEKLIKTELERNTKVSYKLNELDNTLLEKVSSDSDLPKLALQLTSKIAKDLNRIENIEHLELNSNIIPENDEELLKAEPQTNTKLSFHLGELNNTFLDKTSVLEDIPKLNTQLSETFRTSENLQQIENIKFLHKNTNVIPENYLKDGELPQPNNDVALHLNGNSDESPIESGIISKIIENQKPNMCTVSNVSDDIQSEVKEPSKVNLHLETKSGFHFSETSNDSFGFKVSRRHEFDEELSETGHSNDLTNEDNASIKKQQIKSANFLQHTDSTNIPESYFNEISSLNKDHEVATSRDISFDNGIECRSPSPPTISDSPSYVDCNDVQFDSPNDSGIVSSQAYTPDEHIQLKTFHSEIFNKNAPDPFAVLQKSEETLTPKPSSSFNVRTVPISQNKEPMINFNIVPDEMLGSLTDGCTNNSLRETSIKISTPDRPSKVNSDVFVAKVSMKTVNIEEVKLPYDLRSDIISVAKLESPTFAKEVICIPNLSPPPTCMENTFQVENNKDFVINGALPNNSGDYVTLNKCEKYAKNCYLETDGLPSCKDSELTINRVNDLPSKDSTDSIPQYSCIQKELPKISDKSPEILIENLKNNNINVYSSDNIINVSLPTHRSERELASETVMSNDSLKELGESPSELTPDTKMNKEKLNSLLLHSALLHDVSDKTEIISSRRTNAKLILPGKDHSRSSNELFEKKANEIIFSVLHSAVGEIQNINQSLTDIQHIIESQSDKSKDLEDHPDEILVKCTQKPSDHLLIDDTDLIMSMAVGIVNDVISSSKQMVDTNIIPNVLNKDLTKNEATQQKTITGLNDISTNNQNGPGEDSANSNHDVPSLGCDNIVHLPSCEINSNIFQSTEGSRILESRQETEPNLLNKLDSRVTKDMSENDVGSTIEIKVLRKTDDEELPGSSRISVKADTHNSIEESYTNGDLTFDDKSCDTPKESISIETEGSMEDFIYNNIDEESSNFAELCDFLHFSVYNSHYVEVSGSDEESTDEENDGGSDQASDNDSFLPVQSRRVKIYPYALSPIYEDDSACEDAMSSSSSPRFNERAARNSGHDHTSILSLLQSVSDRLKEADLEDTSREEIYLSSSSEVPVASDRFNKDGSREPEDITCPSKTNLAASAPEDDKASSGARSGLFISKSFAENKSNPALGRQSFLLNLTSQPDISGKKSKYSIPCLSSEASASPKSEPNPNQSTDPSPNTIVVNSLTSDSALPTQSSATDKKPRVTPKSVYYQYFNATQNYLSSIETNESPAQEKLENSKIKAESDTNAADSDTLKFNPRPGKAILSDIIDQENKIELKADVLDATSWAFPNGVNIRVIRGCWILYEKPHFEGRAHVLEEGEAVLRHLWDLPEANDEQDKITIGSVKRVVKDYLPEVVISSLQDPSDAIYIRTEVPSLENLVGRHPRSLEVNSGVWLAYTEHQYSGTVTALEEGCKLCQIQNSGLKSMRPLKMGGLKVQLPTDPKIILYEKPHFEGWSREITEHVSAIGSLTRDGENGSCQDFCSIQVIGGIWVGYENERYKGHQYLLEEGDYEEWHAWGGYTNTLQSIRFLQADFLEAFVTLCETDEEDEKQINLFNQAIPDLELAGYKTRTQCINVRQGMWVAYEQKHFCGEQYILEKGRYKTYMDWGGSNNTILSIRPVLLEPLGRNDVKHLIKAYSRTEFQGEDMNFTEGLSDFTSFMPMSFKVLRGCWLLGYGSDDGDNLCVLEEGHFPDLASCGCPTAEIKSIKPIDYVFAEPSVSLFALDSCEGRQLHFEDAVTSVLSKDIHFYTQSVWVRRGLWIAFESANFLGRQMLLDPQQIQNWSQFSGWKAIGSLRPLRQPSVYFMIKNRDKDKYLTVTGKLADSRATFVSVSPRNGQTTQIWYFCRGFLKSKANDSCLDVIGGKNIPGSKVSLWSEHGKTRQKWKIDKGGTISSYISDDLVLDLKGGNYYDKNYIVVNRVQDHSLTQKWDIELL